MDVLLMDLNREGVSEPGSDDGIRCSRLSLGIESFCVSASREDKLSR